MIRRRVDLTESVTLRSVGAQLREVTFTVVPPGTPVSVLAVLKEPDGSMSTVSFQVRLGAARWVLRGGLVYSGGDSHRAVCREIAENIEFRHERGRMVWRVHALSHQSSALPGEVGVIYLGFPEED